MKQEAILFFSDLRYIVIDEVHYFMGENRIENKPWYLFEIAFGFLCTFYSSALAR